MARRAPQAAISSWDPSDPGTSAAFPFIDSGGLSIMVRDAVKTGLAGRQDQRISYTSYLGPSAARSPTPTANTRLSQS